MKTVTERFLKYVSFDTQSDEFSETCPSTAKQKKLGAALVEEMLQMGIADAHMGLVGIKGMVGKNNIRIKGCHRNINGSYHVGSKGNILLRIVNNRQHI
mgnify:CR=1 FL=1